MEQTGTLKNTYKPESLAKDLEARSDAWNPHLSLLMVPYRYLNLLLLMSKSRQATLDK